MPNSNGQQYLTERQFRLMDFIERYRKVTENNPSQDEMAADLGCSKHTIQELLEPLERKGIIMRKPGSARNLRIMNVNWRELSPFNMHRTAARKAL